MTHRSIAPMPLVSVVITTFDSEAVISDGLRSVLAQSWTDYEIIVVDDASRDSTCSRVEESLNGFHQGRLIRMPKNTGGPAEPRNVGVRAAVGDWIAFLDADDAWHPQKLELSLQNAQREGVDFVSTEKCWFRQWSEIESRLTHDWSRGPLPLRRVTHRNLVRKNFLCTASVMARRKLFLDHPFDPNPAYRAIEDYRCWLDVHRSDVPYSVRIQSPLVFYRVGGASISASKLGMIRKHHRLYSDYFAGSLLRWPLVFRSMFTYAVGSLVAQVKYKRTKCW